MASSKVDIHQAAGQGNLVGVKAFLKAGGMIDKRDADHWTPLMLAVREGHLEVARQLLRSGAALELRDNDKWTAMHVAAANGHPHCCQLLLDRGGNPRAVDENKRTPLHWATRYGYAAVVELLLKRGADPNSKDAEGKTAKDVVGSDLTEDSREIIFALLRDHAQRAKDSKQRRGSCPAIPRAAMIAAVNASNETKSLSASIVDASSSTPTAVGSPKSPSLLPSVVVMSKNVTTAPAGGNEGSDTGHSSRHNSFSAAALIRDHLATGENQGGPSAGGSPPIAAATATTTSTTASPPVLLSASARGGTAAIVQDVAGEVDALKKALRAAEERARASEQSLSRAEERRAKEEERARRLEERVAHLEETLYGRSAAVGDEVTAPVRHAVRRLADR